MDNVVLVLNIASFILSALSLFFAIYAFVRVMKETSKRTQIIYDHLNAEERAKEIEEQFGEIIAEDFNMEM